MALGNLADLEELEPTPGRPDPLSLYHKVGVPRVQRGEPVVAGFPSPWELGGHMREELPVCLPCTYQRCLPHTALLACTRCQVWGAEGGVNLVGGTLGWAWVALVSVWECVGQTPPLP